MEKWMDIRPHWMVRHGNFLLLGLLCCFLLCSTVIPYPVTVEGPLRLVPSERPSAAGYYGLLSISEKDGKKIRAGQEVMVRHVGEDRGGVRCRIGVGPWIHEGADSLWVRVDLPRMGGDGKILEGAVMTEDGSLFKHIVAAIQDLWPKW